MYRLYIALVVFLSLHYFTIKDARCDDTCNISSINGRELSGSIESRRNGGWNDTGEWVTSFGAERTAKGNQTDINMVVNHKYLECLEKTTVKIQGIIRESPFRNQLETSETSSEPKDAFLRFHQRTGTNAIVINNGKSLQKLRTDKWDGGVAFTNRPLKDDELFELVIDLRGESSANAIGIGITTYSPDTMEIPAHMNNLKSGNWMMYLTNVFRDGKSIKDSYMKNLKELKVGDRIGIKRTSANNLHLYINGVDQGVADNGIPSSVYGVFELYDSIYKVTIIDN